MRFVYPAIFRKNESGKYQGYFPDLDGCGAEGETLDDAIDNANEAAATWISLEIDEINAGRAGSLPEISDVEDLELEEGDIVRSIAVTLRLMDGWDE